MQMSLKCSVFISMVNKHVKPKKKKKKPSKGTLQQIKSVYLQFSEITAEIRDVIHIVVKPKCKLGRRLQWHILQGFLESTEKHFGMYSPLVH